MTFAMMLMWCQYSGYKYCINVIHLSIYFRVTTDLASWQFSVFIESYKISVSLKRFPNQDLAGTLPWQPCWLIQHQSGEGDCWIFYGWYVQGHSLPSGNKIYPRICTHSLILALLCFGLWIISLDFSGLFTHPNDGKDLNHWGWVTHICIGKPTIIGSYNGLSPGRRQAVI